MSFGNEDALRCGIGPLLDVSRVLADLPREEAELSRLLLELGELLNEAMNLDGGSTAVTALMCSCVNVNFHEHGYLWNITSKGLPEYIYITVGPQRKAFAALARLPSK